MRCSAAIEALHVVLVAGGVAAMVWSGVGPSRSRVQAAEVPVTYSRQVARILYANCTTCHHPGGAGPFSLLTYKDAQRWGQQILTVTQSRFMPPWLPEPGYGDFLENRRLSDADRETLRRWILAGMPLGDLSEVPPAPVYTVEWQLGKPDLVLAMDEPFETPESGTDLFRNFILPYPLDKTQPIRAMEILPGTAAAVHHANVILDRTGSYRREHPKEWKTGVPGMELIVDAGSTFDPDSHFLFWKPDSPALVEPEGMEWHLDPGDDLILNMHLKPTGKAEQIQAKIGLYFSKSAATRRPMLLQLEDDAALDIPPGQPNFVVQDELQLPIAVKVMGVYPHAHYLGKEMQAYAILPDGKKRWLVWIKDWDIDRQSVYRYREPLLLPKGTVVHMRYVYDNTSANPHNPHDPPVRVKAGNRSEDEMGHLWLQVLPVDAEAGGKDSRLLLEEAWMANHLRKNANDSIALYNLAAVKSQEGRSDEAISLYQRLLEHAPNDARALTALGAALEGSGDWKQAAQRYEQALRVNSEQNDARFDLARLELVHEQYGEAERQYRELLLRTPKDAAAHGGLGTALVREGQDVAARGEFELALRIDPGEVSALGGLGEMELVAGNMASAIDYLQRAIRAQDDADTRRRLAMAFAQSGHLDEAADHLRQAQRLQPKDPLAYALLSQVLAAQGRVMDAIREQQTALSLVPNDADGWNNLGALHMRAEQPAAARRDFEQALVVAPDHAAAKANLQRLQARQ